MYTICTKEEWRADNFDPWYFESVYGVFKTTHEARMRMKAWKMDGIVIDLGKQKTLCAPREYRSNPWDVLETNE